MSTATSSRVVTEPKEDIARFVQECIGLQDGWERYSVIGIVKNNVLVGGVVYTGFVRNGDRFQSCEMHVGAIDKRWLSRSALKAIFEYPFIQLGCERVTGLVPGKNAHALQFDLKIGFELESIAERSLPDDDMIVLRMFKEDCRWINEKATFRKAA